MDIQKIFYWLAMISCGLLLVRAKRSAGRGWLVVSGGIVVLGLVGLALFPENVGAFVGILWGMLLVFPMFLIRRIGRDALGQRYRRAAWQAVVVSWLHPADGWLEMPRFYRALALAQSGRREDGARLLEALAEGPRVIRHVSLAARLQLYRMRGQWEGLLEWVESRPASGEGDVRQEPSVILSHLRALGEVGRLSEMLELFEATRARLERQPEPAAATCRCNLFAFTGRTLSLEEVLSGPLAGMTAEAKDFWRQTARMASGDTALAREAFLELAARSADHDLQRAVERRLSHRLATAETTLGEHEKELLVRLEVESTKDLAYHPQPAGGLRQARVTLALVALNTAMFGVEVALGGAENLDTLYRLGALMSEPVLVEHEWYRLLAAMFLHYGPFHLAMNMLALIWIGPWVEQTLGRWRYAVLYFAAGLGSMGIVLALTVKGWMREELLVGASGAIMSLIGATGALLAKGGRRDGSRLAWQRFRGVLFVVALQVVFDFLTPQVSLTAHAAGVALGAVLGWLLDRNGFTRKPGG